MSNLLNEGELLMSIRVAFAAHHTGKTINGENPAFFLLDLFNRQKQLYADGVIGKDVKQTDYIRNRHLTPHPSSTLTSAYRKGVNETKAEQRERNKL